MDRSSSLECACPRPAESGDCEQKFFEQTLDFMRRNKETHFQASHAAEDGHVLMVCIRLLSPAQVTETRTQIVAAAVVWLHENHSAEFNLDALADHLGISRYYASRIFRDVTGKTISRKLREIRIEKAANLLQQKLPVGKAGRAVGYSSAAHFTKAFVVEKGVTPSEYRQRQP